MHQNDISRTSVLTDNKPCSIPEDNNNINIYNSVTICEWQSGFVAHVTLIVLLPAGAECWHAVTGKSPTGGALLSVTLTSCWGGLCVHPGGGGDRRSGREREREEGGRIKWDRMEHQAISIFSISLWICKPDRSSRHQWLSSPWNSRRERSAPLWRFHPIMVDLSAACYRYLCVCRLQEWQITCITSGYKKKKDGDY